MAPQAQLAHKVIQEDQLALPAHKVTPAPQAQLVLKDQQDLKVM
jgi:hypothetical protein